MEIFDVPLDKVEEDNIRENYGDEAEELLLGESLARNQDYPILVRPHATLADWFILVDGHRRCRAAKRAGLKTLKAILVKAGLSPSEIHLIQLRTDIHKKNLTLYERSILADAMRKANPGLTVKQLAEKIEMIESLLWKYLQASKLGPEALEAYRRGELPLNSMIEVAKLAHEDQPAMLSVKSREASGRERKARTAAKSTGAPAVRTAKIKCPLVNGPVVTVAGDALSLDEAIEALGEAQKAMKKARDQGLDASTAQRVWSDMAAAS